MNDGTIEEEGNSQLTVNSVESDYSGYGSSYLDQTEDRVAAKRVKLDQNRNQKILDCSDERRNHSLDESLPSQNRTGIDIARMCSVNEPIESTRIASESTNELTHNELTFDNRTDSQTYLDRSSFKTILLDDEEEDSKVSIISQLVNLILTIHSNIKKISLNGVNASISMEEEDEYIMKSVCYMKTVRDLTSTLCAVHEAVGLSDLKLLSYSFNDEVDNMWVFLKGIVTQPKIADSTIFEQKVRRLLELVGGLSLAAVDHIKKDDGNLYIQEDFRGELSIYFLTNQNRFLSTMLDEAKETVDNGIQEIKELQLSTTHEMSEDIVDGIMNILISLGTLFQQCQDFSLVYLKSIRETSGQFFAEECHHLRDMLTDVIDYNENIAMIIEKSKLVAKNCDALEEFIDAPVVLADVTKCICKSAGKLTNYVVSHKTLDDVVIDALYESLEKFVFAGKTVRVGVSMLVQEVEKDLNVPEDNSIIPFVHCDSSFDKRSSLCPMNTSEINMNSLDNTLKTKLTRCKRASLAPEQYVNRYMDLTDV